MGPFETDIEYLKEKRDNAVDRFAQKLKDSVHTDDELQESFRVVLRMCHQVKLAEDASIIFRLSQTEQAPLEIIDTYPALIEKIREQKMQAVKAQEYEIACEFRVKEKDLINTLELAQLYINNKNE
jgi:hypothetical protein